MMIRKRRAKRGLPNMPCLLVVAVAAATGGFWATQTLAGGEPNHGASGPEQRTLTEMLPGNLLMELVFIEAGEFMMGALPGDGEARAHEQPRHAVRIEKPFYIGVHEVTQAQWRAVMGTTLIEQRAIMDPASPQGGLMRGEGPDHPMYYVRWQDARAFCRHLSELTGSVYRLPSEAEWEYACRAGCSTTYYWGEAFDGEYAWYEGNSDLVLHPVGRKQPNGWGLFDMAGNAEEWCAGYYYTYDENGTTAGQQTRADGYHTLRGGSFGGGRANMRVSHRFRAGDGHFIGFRVVRDVK